MTLLLLVFIAFRSMTAQPGSAQAGPVAFVDVNVVPMDSEHVLPHSTVITNGARIIAVGSVRSVPIPKRALRIDGRARFLMPGLADMHVHLNIRGAVGLLKNEDYAMLFLANGVTTVRNMWGNADILAFRRAINSGAVLGPQIYTTGPVTDGNPPIRPLSRVVQTPEEAIQAVDQDKRDGYDALKVYNRLKAEVYEAMVARAGLIGLPVYGHVPNEVGIFGVLEAHQASIEHVEGYLEALDKDGTQVNESKLVADTVKAGTWNCVTLVFYQGAVAGEEAAKLLAKPSMRFVPPALREVWKNNPQLTSLTEYQFGRLRLYDQKRRDFMRALHRGGARLLVGTDTPNQFVVPGFAVHEELANLVEVGLTPFEAIRAATSGAADFLKSQTEWGRVASGLRADLLLVEGNPLQAVENAERRVGVMVGGRWIPESTLRESLERMAASFPTVATK
jgi:imidazolonepropionase-like amidohydrolase